MFRLSDNQLREIGISATAFLIVSIVCNAAALLFSHAHLLYFVGTSFAIVGSLLIMIAFHELGHWHHSEAIPKYILTTVPLNLTAFGVAIVVKYIIDANTAYAAILLILYFLSYLLYILYFFTRRTKARIEKFRREAVAFFVAALVMFSLVIVTITHLDYRFSTLLLVIGAIFLVAGTMFNSVYEKTLKGKNKK